MKKLFGRDWNQRLEGARQIAEQNAPTNVAGLLDVQEKKLIQLKITFPITQITLVPPQGRLMRM